MGPGWDRGDHGAAAGDTSSRTGVASWGPFSPIFRPCFGKDGKTIFPSPQSPLGRGGRVCSPVSSGGGGRQLWQLLTGSKLGKFRAGFCFQRITPITSGLATGLRRSMLATGSRSPGQGKRPALGNDPKGCTSEGPSERVRPPRGSPAPRFCPAMAAAGVAAILGLATLLPAAAFPCGAPHPDNTTELKLLGTWLYVGGAAQFPQHLLELLLIDHGCLHVGPRAGERGLLVTQRVAVGDQCLTNNSTYLEVAGGDTTLVRHAKTQQTVGTLVNLSSEDVLLVQYQLQRERMYLGLYLYARSLNGSTALREEFEGHAKRLGLSEEEIVYAPWKTELCRAEEVEEGKSPCSEPTAPTASPPPGTQRRGTQ
ncbi:uncharacterized protein O9250_011258 [Rhynochetos jubatus]